MANIKINGVDIYYELRGNLDSDKTIMFLNGVMATTASWLPISEIFEEEGYKVVLHDFKGQLKSGKPEKLWEFTDHADDAVALMNALGIEKANMIGTSYGGEVALLLALRYPERTESITVIDSVSEITPHIEAAVASWIDAAETKDGCLFFRDLLPYLYSNNFIGKNRAWLTERQEKTGLLPPEYFEGQISLYRVFLTLNITKELHGITCPALIICGENDILKPPCLSKLISSKIEGSEYVLLPDCGHVAIFEKAEELKSIISGFIKK